MKIIKHCHEEGSEVAGVLLGLVKDGPSIRNDVTTSIMEITNCFALPRETLEDEDMDDMDYQNIMIRHLRNVNVDHLVVGAYQANPYGSTVARYDTVDFIRKQYLEGGLVDESVILMYDPTRGAKGFLSLKAFRLSSPASKLFKDGELNAEAMKNNRVSFDSFFEEIPVQIRNSHLISGLMCEIEEEMRVDEGKQFLDMGSGTVLEKSLQNLMKCVEDLSRYTNHVRQTTQRQQQVVRENSMRANRGEPPLTEEEVSKIVKPFNAMHRLDALLNSCQTLNYCQQTSAFASQNIGKLFVAKALQGKD